MTVETIVKEVMVKKKITTWTCDLCGYQTKSNKGCCNDFPVERCSFCGKDCCRNCRKFLSEDFWSDYPSGLNACKECEPKATEAWEWADDNAGRHDDIEEVTMKRFKELTSEQAEAEA